MLSNMILSKRLVKDFFKYNSSSYRCLYARNIIVFYAFYHAIKLLLDQKLQFSSNFRIGAGSEEEAINPDSFELVLCIPLVNADVFCLPGLRPILPVRKRSGHDFRWICLPISLARELEVWPITRGSGSLRLRLLLPQSSERGWWQCEFDRLTYTGWSGSDGDA